MVVNIFQKTDESQIILLLHMLAVDRADEQFDISQNHHTTAETLQCEQSCLNERLKCQIN